MVKHKKAIAGLTKGHSLEDIEPREDEEGEEEEAPADLNLLEQAKGARNAVIIYCGLALLVAVLWDALHINLQVNEKSAVWVTFYNNGTIDSEHPLEEQPASLRVKMMAVYLAEDVNATTLQPLYGARRKGVRPDMGAGVEGVLTQLQAQRRVWTHASCDPDGDGWIHDCDVSAGWKYRWLMRDWVDLALESPDPFTPQRHEVPAGDYRFVVVQICLQNLENASTYAVFGGQQSSLHTWRRAAPRYGGSCFLLARPMAQPLTLEHGDDVLVLLSYDLTGTFRQDPTGYEDPEEWECFAAPTAAAPNQRHCAKLPSLQPSWIKRSMPTNDTLLDDKIQNDWFSVIRDVSRRQSFWKPPVASPPPPPLNPPPLSPPPEKPPAPPFSPSPLVPPNEPVSR